ncbi:MAG: hypothetical protein K0R66_1207 [Gammaproteobacteria bacterium]|jgi:hypothetical protein|nr:hypothetical protein [Gammaproteobacteria bacterium]
MAKRKDFRSIVLQGAYNSLDFIGAFESGLSGPSHTEAALYQFSGSTFINLEIDVYNTRLTKRFTNIEFVMTNFTGNINQLSFTDCKFTKSCRFERPLAYSQVKDCIYPFAGRTSQETQYNQFTHKRFHDTLAALLTDYYQGSSLFSSILHHRHHKEIVRNFVKNDLFARLDTSPVELLRLLETRIRASNHSFNPNGELAKRLEFATYHHSCFPNPAQQISLFKQNILTPNRAPTARTTVAVVLYQSTSPQARRVEQPAARGQIASSELALS